MDGWDLRNKLRNPNGIPEPGRWHNTSVPSEVTSVAREIKLAKARKMPIRVLYFGYSFLILLRIAISIVGLMSVPLAHTLFC